VGCIQLKELMHIADIGDIVLCLELRCTLFKELMHISDIVDFVLHLKTTATNEMTV
jgi:hypothetical protein